MQVGLNDKVWRGFRSVLPCSLMLAMASTGPAIAAGCAFQPQGEGRVAAVIDARSFRLEDGREIRLAGIEPAAAETAKDASALAALVGGRQVTLRGEDDAPDRYGRQPAFVFVDASETPVQAQLLAQGVALANGAVLLAFGCWRGRRLRRSPHGGGNSRPHRPSGRLERAFGLKKRGKSRRYFDRDWAFYGGRRQGIVRAPGRGDDVPEFRPELDTGLCCDYFKAHAAGVRSSRDCHQVLRK